MKKLINDPHEVVKDSLAGFAVAHADLVTVHDKPDFYVTRVGGAEQGKVGVVSGGGSGHEPLHAGFVGEGMLSAAVPGPVFTSPTPDPIVEAIKAADGGAGVLLLVKNYTGDVLNFETAADLAGMDDIEIRTVVIDDDVAVKDSTWTAGRRGVAGTLLVEKIAGAAAQSGLSLDEVAEVATKVNAQVRSMGLALEACTVPHVGKPSFDLPDDEVEIGIGIHGEPGRERIKLESADKLTARLVEPIVSDLPFESGDDVVVLVNGMGGTPIVEQYIVYNKVQEMLGEKGIKIARSLVGNFVTSLEMQGVSVTLLKVDDELLKLYDAPVVTPSLRWGK